MGSKVKLVDTSGNRFPKKPKPNEIDIAVSHNELHLNENKIGESKDSGTPFSVLISQPVAPSDIRLKNILRKLYTTEDGINIYSFIYKKHFGIDGIFQGVIAQELIGTQFEDALVKVGDYYYVNYYKLKDVSFERIG